MRTLMIAMGLVLGLGAVNAQAEDKTFELKMSSWVPPQHPLNPALAAWGKDIEKESNGTLKTTLFPAEQLGKAFDHYDMTRDGITDFAYINPGYQPGRFPIVALAEQPFLIANAKGGSAAVDEWYRKYSAKEMKDIRVCFSFVLDPGAIHSRKKVVVPADMNGMKVRPGNATSGAFVTLLGGTNVQASAPEAREVLERGVADAITFPWGSTILFGIDKVVKFHTDVSVFSAVFVWGMNKDKYNAMSETQRGIIDRHCTTEWAEKVASPWADFEFGGRAKIAAMSDHEIIKPNAEQTALWHKAAEPLKAKWAAAVKAKGEDPDQVSAELTADLKKRGALAE
jgi:TRAP-type transport system periplasmic protein